MAESLRIDLQCPECGNHQSEPSAAVSTFCKTCGAHITLERKKSMFGLRSTLVIKSAPSRGGDTHSGIDDAGLGPVTEIDTPEPTPKSHDPYDPDEDPEDEDDEAGEPGVTMPKHLRSKPAAQLWRPTVSPAKTTRGFASSVTPSQNRPFASPTAPGAGRPSDFDDLGLGNVRELDDEPVAHEEPADANHEPIESSVSEPIELPETQAASHPGTELFNPAGFEQAKATSKPRGAGPLSGSFSSSTKPEASPPKDLQLDELGLGEVREWVPVKPQQDKPVEFIGDLFDSSPEARKSGLPRRAQPVVKRFEPPQIPQPPRRLGSGNSPYFKEVTCFECGHKHQTGRNSKQSRCPACGEDVMLTDIDIHTQHTAPVLTLGNVTVHKTGALHASRVVCHNLRVYGAIASPVEVKGELSVHSTMDFPELIRCEKLTVDRRISATFHQPVQTKSAEISGHVTGDIVCEGQITINNRGSVDGNVSATSVNIAPGGELLGSMTIIRKAT